MDKGQFRLLEWTVENFSCWNSETHEKVIKSQTSSGREFHLFPRGLSGRGEHLVVQIPWNGVGSVSGELSFIGSDESVLCTQEGDSREEVSVLEFSSTLKLEEVVTQIRKNEAIHGDRLTLRFRENSTLDCNLVENMRSTIDAFDISFKIFSNIFKGSYRTEIARLLYAEGEGEKGRVDLIASKNLIDLSKMTLDLYPFLFKRNTTVITRISVLNNEDDVERIEENDHIFCNSEKWTFSNSLTIEEIEKERVSVIVCIKIIPGTYHHHSVELRTFCAQAGVPFPLKRFKPPGKSVPEEHFSKSHSNDISNKTNNSVAELTKELMCLYQDHDFSDFRLKCGDVSFPVHRNILSARSPVFKTMLSTDMKETVSGCMDIVDLDPSTLCLFLTFLYTGSVEDLQGESALKLYYAADKYQVPTLKRECANFLCGNVSISNVCDILSLANRHQDDQLTAVAHDFILDNYNDVLGSEEWKKFMEDEPFLAVKTLTHFAAKKFVTRNKNTLVPPQREFLAEPLHAGSNVRLHGHSEVGTLYAQLFAHLRARGQNVGGEHPPKIKRKARRRIPRDTF